MISDCGLRNKRQSTLPSQPCRIETGFVLSGPAQPEDPNRHFGVGLGLRRPKSADSDSSLKPPAACSAQIVFCTPFSHATIKTDLALVALFALWSKFRAGEYNLYLAESS